MSKTNPTRFETYRAYAADGTLLYVGMSVNALARLSQHASSSDWYGEMRRFEVDVHDSHTEAAQHEKRLIEQYRPLWNVAHADDPEVRRQARSRRRRLVAKPETSKFCFDPAFWKEHPLSQKELQALLCCATEATKKGLLQMPQRELAYQLDVTRQRACELVAGLVRKGYMYRGTRGSFGVPAFYVNTEVVWNGALDERDRQRCDNPGVPA